MRAVRHVLFCVLLSLATALAAAQMSPERKLTLDDLFNLSVINSAALSPDGEWIAAVVLRPALPGEVYGRTFYEYDIGRADVWLISRRTGERRNLTRGARDAAGFWCATWSPDGQWLAMMSTKPEGKEPRGGDNIRLYVWDKKSGALKRLSERAMMTQTMGGSPLYKVDLQGRRYDGAGTARCSDRENAPFMWLDNTTLLAVMLPPGSVSGFIDAYSRSTRHAVETRNKLRAGQEPTATAVESGVPVPSHYRASLQRVDVARGRTQEIASVPIHPLDGSLQISLSPDGRTAAVLATTGAIPHVDGERFAYPYAAWSTDKKLGFVDLAPGSPVRWVDNTAPESRYILDLLPWSPQGSAIAVRARPSPKYRAQSLFVVTPDRPVLERISPKGISVAASWTGVDLSSELTAIWLDERRLVMRSVRAEDELTPIQWYSRTRNQQTTPRIDWWIFARDAQPANLTAGMEKVPGSLRPSNVKDRLIGVAGDALWAVDVTNKAATQLTSQPLPAGAEIIWPSAYEGIHRGVSELGVAGRGQDGVRPLVRAVLTEGAAEVTPIASPSTTAKFFGYSPAHGALMFTDQSPIGTFLWVTQADGGSARKLLSVNEHMAQIKFGEMRLIDYRSNDGEEIKAGVVLPPDYEPGKKYPTLVWVYAGTRVRDMTYAYFDIYMPGMYNLHLYAAQGYVVLAPSMPLKPDGWKNDDYIDLPKGVMPAIDRMIDLGITDPDRVAVMGQSYGGYSTYSLVTYTNRFKAAIAMAGLTDLVSLYGQFDPTARDYVGIEHQKSANWGLSEQGQVSMGVPPTEDLWRYLRNSPLYFADRVQTPLLLIHGEQDIRGPMTQAEEFFYLLYRQGKRARLLRYWGEDHGLRQSPANVRDIVEEILKWLELNMPEKPVSQEAGSP